MRYREKGILLALKCTALTSFKNNYLKCSDCYGTRGRLSYFNEGFCSSYFGYCVYYGRYWYTSVYANCVAVYVLGSELSGSFSQCLCLWSPLPRHTHTPFICVILNCRRTWGGRLSPRRSVLLNPLTAQEVNLKFFLLVVILHNTEWLLKIISFQFSSTEYGVEINIFRSPKHSDKFLYLLHMIL